MLNKSVLYKIMTVEQLGKRVDTIKMKLNNVEDFDKRLELLDDLSVITGVLVRRCKHDVTVVSYTMKKLDELASLVK